MLYRYLLASPTNIRLDLKVAPIFSTNKINGSEQFFLPSLIFEDKAGWRPQWYGTFRPDLCILY